MLCHPLAQARVKLGPSQDPPLPHTEPTEGSVRVLILALNECSHGLALPDGNPSQHQYRLRLDPID